MKNKDEVKDKSNNLIFIISSMIMAFLLIIVLYDNHEKNKVILQKVTEMVKEIQKDGEKISTDKDKEENITKEIILMNNEKNTQYNVFLDKDGNIYFEFDVNGETISSRIYKKNTQVQVELINVNKHFCPKIDNVQCYLDLNRSFYGFVSSFF